MINVTRQQARDMAEAHAEGLHAELPREGCPECEGRELREYPDERKKSWAPEVIADDSGQWSGNALRFATKAEAEANVRNLAARWTLVTDTRVVESDDPVNYRWTDEDGLLPVGL